MFLIFDDRPSDSPFVERIWRCHSARAGTFLSIAASHLEMVVTRLSGKTTLSVRGPETKAPRWIVLQSGLASASSWALSCHSCPQGISSIEEMRSCLKQQINPSD